MKGVLRRCWPEGRVKIARMTLTIKLDRNWSSFQLANSAPPLSVTDSAIAPSARMVDFSIELITLMHRNQRMKIIRKRRQRACSSWLA